MFILPRGKRPKVLVYLVRPARPNSAERGEITSASRLVDGSTARALTAMKMPNGWRWVMDPEPTNHQEEENRDVV